MTKVKICGLTNLEDAKKAEDLGADFLGFIFFEKSPRVISPDAARDIIDNLHGGSEKVGLFLDHDINFVKNQTRLCRLDLIQLHGNEDPGYAAELSASGRRVIKSFKMKKDFDFSILDTYDMVDFFLFDTFKQGVPGGTGLIFDWEILKGKRFSKPIFLAGGLKPDNVKKAIEKVRPYAVDVASGVESEPGRKDYKLLEKLITAIKRED
ncbi:MAG: phosphoribosylanthranilate isomerase [Candidatus Omnitrophica bacterium]|nr:phosphoribosylanthranilate isomerase [Candidatus Omnitrophota bacterium]